MRQIHRRKVVTNRSQPNRSQESFSRPIKTSELRNERINRCLMRKIAQIHSMNLPISKRALWVQKMFEFFQNRFKAKQVSLDAISKDKELAERILSFEIETEMKWFLNAMNKIVSKITFTHNDLNITNILIRDQFDCEDDKVLIIDYENCGYNYRGYDIGYFFRVKCFDEMDAYFKVMDIKTIPEVEQRVLIREYLQELKKLNNTIDPIVDNEEHLLKETNFFALLSDLISIAFCLISMREFNKIPLVNICI
ncbi:hypothetical protein B4U79_17349 [Dinothrombium tinctorium]|uniref:Choline/ethanolamine kinase-like protein n=1 Tax=Dinothrombium tinctorium TaxID=1965070 RepID=A0A3S3PNZ3_9ACAR|nr:hypothetical protein B4U79_17349 [Dinothrombium tinctorium]